MVVLWKKCGWKEKKENNRRKNIQWDWIKGVKKLVLKKKNTKESLKKKRAQIIEVLKWKKKSKNKGEVCGLNVKDVKQRVVKRRMGERMKFWKGEEKKNEHNAYDFSIQILVLVIISPSVLCLNQYPKPLHYKLERPKDSR